MSYLNLIQPVHLTYGLGTDYSCFCELPRCNAVGGDSPDPRCMLCLKDRKIVRAKLRGWVSRWREKCRHQRQTVLAICLIRQCIPTDIGTLIAESVPY